MENKKETLERGKKHLKDMKDITSIGELQGQFDLLSENFKILDTLHQEALKELLQIKRLQQYGIIFTFESGETKFIPILQQTRGLTIAGQRPKTFKLNFNEETISDWITESQAVLGKVSQTEKIEQDINKKVNDILNVPTDGSRLLKKMKQKFNSSGRPIN